jgi:DNA-binding winged helix-turn-helix (wHTH) protein/tetratricopeptide (TPR) repeat protein
VQAGTEVVFPPFRLDVRNERLLRGSRPVPLTPKALAVLNLLVGRHGRLVTKTEILESVWAGTHVRDAVLKVCIREIRRALKDPARTPRYIETVHRRGYRFIKRIQGVSRSEGDDGRPRASVAGTLVSEGSRRTWFVGREAELAQMQGWLQAALRGDRQVVFVTGEPGIGKTAVVEAFLERLAADGSLWVARGKCLEQFGAGEPYLPVLEAMGRLARAVGGTRLVALLRRYAPTWLVQMPSLVAEHDRGRLQSEILGATSERMLREMAEAAEAMTVDTPLVLVLEDLQWSDFSTLDLLASLARRREPARLLLIGTYREADVMLSHHPLRAVKQELLMRRQCHELPLTFLSEPAVDEYLAARFQDAALPVGLAGAIHQRTDGNPLFMVNVADYLASRRLIGVPGEIPDPKLVLREVAVGVPESLRQMIEKQIDRLTMEEQATLEAASVAGLEFSALAVAAGLDSDAVRVEEVCEGLARRGLFLRPSGVGRLPDGSVAARYGFIHPLYLNVLYHRVPIARRLRLHQRIGERGEFIYGSRVGEIAAELAVHFEMARDFAGAVHHLRQAAGNAARRHANREAIGHLTRAFELAARLAEPERGGLQMAILEQAGTVRRSMGDMQGAAEDFAALIAAAREHHYENGEAKGLFYLGSALSWFDRRRFQEMAGQALDLSARLKDGLLQAHTRGYAAYWNLLLRGWRDEDARASAEAVEAARRGGDRVLLGQQIGRHAYFLCLRSDYLAGCREAREGMQLAVEAGDAFDYLLCQFFLAWGLLHGGRWGEALQVLETGIEMAAKNGHRQWATLFKLQMAWLHSHALHFELARGLCERALREAREASHAHGQVVSLTLLGFAHLNLGEHDRAARHFEEVGDPEERGRLLMDWSWLMPLGLCMAEYRLSRGDLARARREAEFVLRLAGLPAERTYLGLARRTLARVAAAEGDLTRAESEIASALADLDGVEAPVAAWQVRATAAQLSRRLGRTAEARKHLARSAATARQLADSLGAASMRRSFLEESGIASRGMITAGPERRPG